MTKSKSMLTEIFDENLIETGRLLPRDRCTRCGARAYVKAIKGELELLFCGHHAREHTGKLQIDGWLIDDQTHMIFE